MAASMVMPERNTVSRRCPFLPMFADLYDFGSFSFVLFLIFLLDSCSSLAKWLSLSAVVFF